MQKCAVMSFTGQQTTITSEPQKEFCTGNKIKSILKTLFTMCPREPLCQEAPSYHHPFW